ncbi:hypothetical protein Achl_4347 (plasmid) [Pseudarthrobacter chlorophenolicus A6]|uniref:Uncharacterized protein n=1 Tax=Pseudarthrobacter chlorophenolicus (strain ATCC 700700 / DSM 12829 / CIP 107037 / JCM 12360 / KCTC 9906 / NCIMB 13794 / A6) TaxID=452863 RepID=B8HIQ1_PSECP|nr:hypothetical protein [Pseudarthrobacter chlorophenolicus]ACL42298.1 hypothetical protein Achl_4347 [Pseudarthrobacter chlorophenolicus A6]SDQ16159.1 hypothetical protein SAMN04489738_0404 [Pseudarthrobacter chlorophenolicus]
MRTLDRNYLAAHPAGDEPAKFSVTIDIPSSMEVPNNPDGTRPRITVDAVSDTYANLLGLLSYVHDEEVHDNVMAILLENIDEEKLEGFGSLEEAAPVMRHAAAEIVTPFRTFTLSLSLQTEADDEVVSEVSGQLKLTAPNMISAAQALRSMTRPHVLTDIAISFCPETEDDDEYAGSNEVLVVS